VFHYCIVKSIFSVLRVWPLCKIMIDCLYQGGGEFMICWGWLLKKLNTCTFFSR